MSQTTVEEIYTAVQRLPSKERMRLSELLKRAQESGSQPAKTHTATLETSQGQLSDRIPASREAEMQSGISIAGSLSHCGATK
jgi:hypothetical protein